MVEGYLRDWKRVVIPGYRTGGGAEGKDVPGAEYWSQGNVATSEDWK